MKFANFVYINSHYAREKEPFLSRKWLFLPRVLQIYTKFANFAGLCFLRFTTFCSFTHSKALFLAVVLGLVLLALIKI